MRKAVCVFAMAVLMPVGAGAQSWRHGQLGNAIKLGRKVAARPKLTREDEVRLAEAQGHKFEASNPMWPDPLLESYLAGILAKLAAVAKPTPFTYRVRVVNDASLNAFTFGAGMLYVHVGLLARLDNEAELAMVLGHEIAHVTEGHVAAKIEHAYNTELIGEAAVTAGGAAGISISGKALDTAYEATMSAAINGYGRDQEREADRIGLDTMVKAGYDPREAPKTFTLLLAEYGDQGRVANFFYGNHPASQERFDTLTGLAGTKYGADPPDRHPLVNAAEYRRVTRRTVVAAGRFEYEHDHLKTATALFEKARQAAADDPIPHFYLGKIALDSGGAEALPGAIAQFEAALAVEPTYAAAHRELGLASYRQGDRAKAIASLEKYLALQPHAKDAAEIASTLAEMKRAPEGRW